MEQKYNDTIIKSFIFLNKDIYQITNKIYKNLLIFLKPKYEDLHYIEFFNLKFFSYR